MFMIDVPLYSSLLLVFVVSFVSVNDNPPMPQQAKVTVKFFLHATGNIASKCPYDKVWRPLLIKN